MGSKNRTFIRRTRVIAMIAGVLSVTALSTTANALTFTPSETEWLTWPDYCRARYLASGAGRKSRFIGRISSSEIRTHEARMGREVWHWLHHYCAGLVYFDRSQAATSERERDILAESGRSQISGHYVRVPRSHPFFGEVATALGRIHRARGEYDQAMSYINESISFQPTHSSAYALAALIYRDNGQLDEARDILLQGNQACNEQSAEIHYFLGLIFVQRDELDFAESHAARAYELGYPLPGLRAKLQNLGRGSNL